MGDEIAPLILNAKDANRPLYRVAVPTQGVSGELDALQLPAAKLDIRLDEQS